MSPWYATFHSGTSPTRAFRQEGETSWRQMMPVFLHKSSRSLRSFSRNCGCFGPENISSMRAPMLYVATPKPRVEARAGKPRVEAGAVSP